MTLHRRGALPPRFALPRDIFGQMKAPDIFDLMECCV